jgi:hypothetical protein
MLDFLISGNFSFDRKKMNDLFYENGILLPKGWRKLRGKKILPKMGGQYLKYSKQLIMTSYLWIPLIVNFISGIYDLAVAAITPGDQGALEKGIERFMLSPITYINRQIEESGTLGLIKDIISKLLFPFNPLIDDLMAEVSAILTEAKDLTIEKSKTYKEQLKNWTKKVWRKIRDFYDNMKLKTEEKIQEIENRKSTTTPSDSLKTKTDTVTVPTLRRDTVPPELEDTIPAEIDTTGGYIEA